MKITLIVLLVVAILAGGVAVFAGPRLMSAMSDFKPEQKGITVRIQTMAPTDLVEFVTAPGQAEPHTKVDVGAEVSARIVELPFEEGDEVRKGDVIVRLDDEDLKAALDSSNARRDGERYRLRSEEARLTGTLTNLSYAEKEFERIETLFASGDVSRTAFEDAEERLENLKATVEAAKFTMSVIESTLAASEADIKRSKDSLANTVIAAPMDGVITLLNNEVGEQVLGTFNNIGTIIMTIADLNRMILRAEVAESDIARIREGEEARIHFNAYRDEIFAGTVRHIALQKTMSSDGTGVFQVEVEIDLQGRRLRSGLAANVDIQIEEHEGLVVESQAIVERSIEDLPESLRRDHPLIDYSKRTTTVVYRMIDGKATCTPVRTGASDLTHTLIIDGLDESDIVIIGPYKVLEKVKDGEAVKPEGSDDDPPADESEAGESDSSDDGESSSDDPVSVPEESPTAASA